ncbi:FAD:protein FMN transferase [Hydrogenophaga sp. 5NK40-0174]|uniref:FAD:protein FMN transferase n=1 Tax=Hydrogenophaga sp. 5NK40-0174 TaxID=3127649 RepID=UPI003109113A
MTMQRRQIILASLGGAALAAPLPSMVTAAQPPLVWRERHMFGLGTQLSLRAAHTDVQAVDVGLDAAVAAIRRVEASMSLYREDSELVRLNQQGFLDQPSADFLAVLGTAQMVAERSGGQFDATVQPVWQAWADATRQGRLPSAAALAEARQRTGWQHVVVSDQRVAFQRPGMAMTFNGIAQGYAADAARKALQDHGVAHALIDTGEHASLGQSPRGTAWTLGVEDPRDEQRLLAAIRSDGRAVATSADNRSSFSADHRHHHIFDPATADSPSGLSSVTVLAPSAMLADALTKVMFVSGPERIPALARQWQVGVLWVDKKGHWAATSDVALV